MHVDVLDGDVSGVEVGLVHDATMQGNQVFNPGDHGLVQRRFHATNGVFPVVTPHEQFGQQRIKASWHFVTGVGMRVASNPETAREMALP